MEIDTTREVWAVIHASHGDRLKVHSSYSNPDGTCPLGCGRPEMVTTYGIDGIDLMRARTTWDRSNDPDRPYNRINEKRQFWLILNPEDDDD